MRSSKWYSNRCFCQGHCCSGQSIVRSVICKRCCECRCGSPPSLTTHPNENMCHLTMCILVFAVENPTTPFPTLLPGSICNEIGVMLVPLLPGPIWKPIYIYVSEMCTCNHFQASVKCNDVAYAMHVRMKQAWAIIVRTCMTRGANESLCSASRLACCEKAVYL